jgi:chromate reductase, NAD(P)H dehydrogenase (quinone)
MEVAAASARPVLRVAAICGSLRKASFNRGLLRAGTLPLLLPFGVPITAYSRLRCLAQVTTPAAAEVCEDSIPGLRIDELDISDLPIINTDLETGSGSGTVFPPAVEAFRAKVCQADCFLFGAPEYNYSIASMSFATPSLLPALLLVRFRSPARTHLLQGD